MFVTLQPEAVLTGKGRDYMSFGDYVVYPGLENCGGLEPRDAVDAAALQDG